MLLAMLYADVNRNSQRQIDKLIIGYYKLYRVHPNTNSRKHQNEWNNFVLMCNMNTADTMRPSSYIDYIVESYVLTSEIYFTWPRNILLMWCSTAKVVWLARDFLLGSMNGDDLLSDVVGKEDAYISRACWSVVTITNLTGIAYILGKFIPDRLIPNTK